MRPRFAVAVTAFAGAAALAQPAPTPQPTTDPLGAITAVVMYGSEAEAGSGWSASSSPRTIRAASPGRSLTYHVALPEAPEAWRLGVTARRLGRESPVRFDIAIGDRRVNPLVATPSASDFGTYWSPLDRVGGSITLTITPSAAGESWPGVEIAAIQLARYGDPVERGPVSGADETITGRTSAPRGGGGFRGSGGGGGSPGRAPLEEFFPPLEEPDEGPLELSDPPAPSPPPGGDPQPPSPPEPDRDPENPPTLPAPGAGLLLLGLLSHRAVRQRR